MNITFNPYSLHPTELRLVADYLVAVAAKFEQPQPAVGQNTGSVAPAPDLQVGEPAGEETTGSTASTAEPVAAVKATRTRKSKDIVALTGAQLAAQAEAEKQPAAADPVYTMDDVRAALQRYTATNSMAEGIALLKSYGAPRISELDAGQYGLFIAECDGAKE